MKIQPHILEIYNAMVRHGYRCSCGTADQIQITHKDKALFISSVRRSLYVSVPIPAYFKIKRGCNLENLVLEILQHPEHSTCHIPQEIITKHGLRSMSRRNVILLDHALQQLPVTVSDDDQSIIPLLSYSGVNQPTKVDPTSQL